ncbi:Zinc finger MYM-type protein 1 [Dissostichus eleginoides]|uniref:Zinc finger MYM-type protein 1 n=1 Tax=Dissostichus eleginoides TaxID=100907 RepID=A0AAD9F1L8_DISEL|nr:Zinc finger MYM-type protein 1 [Dissostichus eleginoides]
MRAIGNYNPTNKLICQTYDGASCMSGQHGGVQALVKAHCPNALFIHCYAHKLNLVLAQGTNNIQAAKLFFANLDAFHNFFSRSCKRSALLCEVDRAVRVPGGSAVRWNFKGRAVHAIHEGRGSLCITFDKIMTKQGWDKETIAQSASLKQKLEDFDFTFLLGVFQSIFGLTEPLFQVLQSKTVDIKKCQDRIMSTLSALKATRTDETFSRIYEETVKAVGDPVRRRRRGWDDLEQGFNQHQEGDEETVVSFRRLYFQIVDGIVLHMTQRFADMEHLNFFRILEHTSFASFCNPAAFPSSELAQLINTYPFFDEQKLRNELQTLYSNRLFHKPPGELIELLIEDDLQGTLSEVYKLLQLMLTIPATSASAERSFSCLKRIKTYLRNTCGQDRLVNLATISIDSVVVEDLKATGTFYDIVIDHFATMKDRRMAFLFK